MGERVVVDVNMDAKCIHCGKGGATPSGRCLGCLAKLVQFYGLDKPKWPKTGRINPRSRA